MLGVHRLVGRAYGPILAALYAVPAVVWYPSLMLFFGLGEASKIAFGFLLGFFPITLAVLAGIRQVNPQMIAVARAFGARPPVVFVKVMIPAMLFTLVGGLRTGLALTVIGVIVGEILGSRSGMGALINHAYGLFRTSDYVALVLRHARAHRRLRRPRRPGRAPRPAVDRVMTQRARVLSLQILSVLVVLAAWEAVARLGWVDPLFVPAPTAVAAAFLRMGRGALAGLGDTLAKTAVAYVLSVTLGVGLGIAIGSVRALRDVLSPFVVVLYGMPKILVLPWIVLLLGFGTTPAIVYGTIHGLFPVLVLVMGGVRDVDRTLVTVARSFGASTWQLYWKVLLPAIVPTVLAGMRLAIVFCLLGVLIVEMFAGVRGMGHVLGSLANGFQAPELFAATALVSVSSIAIVLGLDALNERLSIWRG